MVLRPLDPPYPVDDQAAPSPSLSHPLPQSRDSGYRSPEHSLRSVPHSMGYPPTQGPPMQQSAPPPAFEGGVRYGYHSDAPQYRLQQPGQAAYPPQGQDPASPRAFPVLPSYDADRLQVVDPEPLQNSPSTHCSLFSPRPTYAAPRYIPQPLYAEIPDSPQPSPPRSPSEQPEYAQVAPVVPPKVPHSPLPEARVEEPVDSPSECGIQKEDPVAPRSDSPARADKDPVVPQPEPTAQKKDSVEPPVSSKTQNEEDRLVLDAIEALDAGTCRGFLGLGSDRGSSRGKDRESDRGGDLGLLSALGIAFAGHNLEDVWNDKPCRKENKRASTWTDSSWNESPWGASPWNEKPCRKGSNRASSWKMPRGEEIKMHDAEAAGPHEAPAPATPPRDAKMGHFSRSSASIRLDKDYNLIAECRACNGQRKTSSIALNYWVTNCDGKLAWIKAGDAAGHFGNSARHVRLADGGRCLEAEVRARNGSWKSDRLCLDEKIENMNGNLCMV